MYNLFHIGWDLLALDVVVSNRFCDFTFRQLLQIVQTVIDSALTRVTTTDDSTERFSALHRPLIDTELISKHRGKVTDSNQLTLPKSSSRFVFPAILYDLHV